PAPVWGEGGGGLTNIFARSRPWPDARPWVIPAPYEAHHHNRTPRGRLRPLARRTLYRHRHRVHARADVLAEALPDPDCGGGHRASDRQSRPRPRPCALFRADDLGTRAESLPFRASRY